MVHIPNSASASPQLAWTVAAQEMVGNSLVMKILRRAIQKVAATHAGVLITGETGTGKELVARLLHRHSGRAAGPFVAVNCAALPANLFNAEVFGYEKGAFTGADRRNPGRVETAHGGTLFLDEVGDLAPEMQVVLLRFLQEGTFERLGSTETLRADVRVVAATHADLEQACREGRFREDLYHRLNLLHLHTPPLRDRGNDVVQLAHYFVSHLSRELGLRPRRLEADALAQLRTHAWPGNVRELSNRIRQALVMAEGAYLTAMDLGLDARPTTPAVCGDGQSLRHARLLAEREALERAVDGCDGDLAAAARSLEISRAQLYRLVKKHGIRC